MGKLKGQSEYKKFLEGKPLSPKKSIIAQCFVCNGEEEGSGEDCKGLSCPLYPYARKWLFRGRKSIVEAEKATPPLLKIIVIAILMSLFASSIWADTASYYTYKSCVREGTSGVWTASGERFNENDLTAAMWGVPFGTRIKVTNIENGKSIIVRINDRGPSKRLVKQGRIIDLSKGAFQRIASLKDGIIRVKIERIGGDQYGR